MYVYKQASPGIYEVGHYQHFNSWTIESSYSEESKAVNRVHFLNGGVGEWGPAVGQIVADLASIRSAVESIERRLSEDTIVGKP